MNAEIGIENLCLARDALTALDIRYFLIDGTLLGLVRNCCFIDEQSNEEDIDVGVMAEDFTVPRFETYKSLMRQNGFTLHCQFGEWGKCFRYQWNRKNIMLDLCFYLRRGDQRIGHLFDLRYVIEISYPARLIEVLSPVDFYGETFMVPKDKEEVLAHLYGDWRTPRSDWDWRISPLNITNRTKVAKWRILRSRLRHRVLAALSAPLRPLRG